jgi:hypothetical protein
MHTSITFEIKDFHYLPPKRRLKQHLANYGCRQGFGAVGAVSHIDQLLNIRLLYML